MKAKTKLIIALIVTAIVIVYGIDVGIRLLTPPEGSERVEYLVVVLVIIVSLLLVDSRLYSSYKKGKAR
jgi:preprotein translocase subunit SecE